MICASGNVSESPTPVRSWSSNARCARNPRERVRTRQLVARPRPDRSRGQVFFRGDHHLPDILPLGGPAGPTLPVAPSTRQARPRADTARRGEPERAAPPRRKENRSAAGLWVGGDPDRRQPGIWNAPPAVMPSWGRARRRSGSREALAPTMANVGACAIITNSEPCPTSEVVCRDGVG